MNEITLFSFIQTKVLLISSVGKSCNIAEKVCDLWKKVSKSVENLAKVLIMYKKIQYYIKEVAVCR